MLKAIQLGQQLTKTEMRNLKGGGDGTCAAVNSKGQVFGFTDKETAIKNAGSGGHWCCASCYKATWLDVSMD